MLEHAIQHIKNGGLIIFPTETAYALGCDATNVHAVNHIYERKGRPAHMPLSIIVADIDMAEKYARFTQEAHALANAHWPGPLTLILECINDALAPGVAHTDHSIALRVSSHITARALARELGKPIIATSANASGQPTCYDVSEIKKQIETDDLCIIDEGPLKQTPTSTIVDARSGISIIRQGAITL